MSKVVVECLYCGNCIVHKPFGTYGWRKPKLGDTKCSVCGESQMLKIKEYGEEGCDVFGYRFSPPFPPKEDKIELQPPWLSEH